MYIYISYLYVCIYICIICILYIYIYVYISCHITRSTAFRWPCVFLMPGKLPMILDVLVPVGFCVLFCVKPVNACFTGSWMKRTMSPTRNLHFCGFFTARNYLVSTQFHPSCVHSSASSSSKNLLGLGFFKVHRQHHMNTYCRTDACKVECPRSLHFKTMWAGKKSFKDFQDRPNVWVPAMLETPGNNLGPSQVKFFTWWTTLHAWQVHMNVNTCPTPLPHKTPRPSKGRGPTIYL